MAEEEKDETNPWTRERSFWQKNGGDLAMLVTSVFFLGLTIFLVGFLVLKPGVPGLSNVFKDPPPAPPRQAEKFYYSVPGEVIMNIAPGKPIVPPPPPAQPAPQQER